jgi:pSer/pThr/pTyr-binding forkhead associated (FHA) protein
VNIVEQIIYFLIPIVVIGVGVFYLVIHKRKCFSCGRLIRPIWRECACASEPSVVFSQEPELEQEARKTSQEKPFSYDDAQPLPGAIMRTQVMLPPTSQAWLLIEGEMSEKRYEIRETIVSIGSSDDNDIVLKDRAVSRHHAKIRIEGKKYFMYDLASTNGTRVNQRKIRKKWIKEGDIIEMGHTRMVFKAGEIEDGIKKQRATARYQHLSGNFEYFDLPTIIQTLLTSESTGTLTVTDQSKRVFAVLFLKAGRVLYARLGHLRGREAFYQLLQSPVQDAFTFKGGLPSGRFEEEEEIGTTTMGLLMEAAHQQDELKALKGMYSNPDRVFGPQRKTLSWDDEKTMGLAQDIWSRLHRGETIAQMVREIPTCEYRIYKVLSVMNEKGLAA